MYIQHIGISTCRRVISVELVGYIGRDGMCPQNLGSTAEKYGKVYLELHMSEVDNFIMWVDDILRY